MAKSKKRKADSSGSKTNNDASNIPEKRSKALVNVQNKVAASSLGNVTLEKAKEKSKPRSDSKLKGKNRDNREFSFPSIYLDAFTQYHYNSGGCVPHMQIY